MTKVFVIAEAGVNHNGSLELAKRLIDVAVDAGADAVKFQTFRADSLVSKTAQKAEYQKQTTAEGESQYDMIKRLELDVAAHRALIAHCEEKNIMFLSTPFDHESIEMLNDLGMMIFKIPSGEITNLPYLRHIGRLDRKSSCRQVWPIFGGRKCTGVLVDAGVPKDKITVLHATTEYPCPIDEVNLRAMLTIRDHLGVRSATLTTHKELRFPSLRYMGASVMRSISRLIGDGGARS